MGTSVTIWWEFADKDDLDHAITVSAPTWYYAREFARSLYGENCIETGRSFEAQKLDDVPVYERPRYQLRWHGNACTNPDNLRMQIRKLNKAGKYTGWRFM